MKKSLIVNSNTIMSLSLSSLLDKEGYSVFSECTDGMKAFNIITKHTVDLILIDCEICELNAFELVKRIRRANIEVKILMMGNKKNSLNVRHAISSGVNGFIFTHDGIDTMVNAFRSVMAGYSFFPMDLSQQSLFSEGLKDAPSHTKLSIREIQVLRQITSGKKNVHIAEDMRISFKTVSTYKYRIMSKLRLSSTVDLLEYARVHGI